MTKAILEVRTLKPRQAAILLREHLETGSVNLFGDRLHLITGEPEKTTKKVKVLMTEAGLDVSSIRLIKPTLEDVFVSVLT